mmetsp:Transcript_15266/g.50663  ORF Transcript_15266/g.50663 Transcript_15266/m.50663 type:complete len:332 (+) Transcript_15266:1295-2290(+)
MRGRGPAAKHPALVDIDLSPAKLGEARGEEVVGRAPDPRRIRGRPAVVPRRVPHRRLPAKAVVQWAAQPSGGCRQLHWWWRHGRGRGEREGGHGAIEERIVSVDELAHLCHLGLGWLVVTRGGAVDIGLASTQQAIGLRQVQRAAAEPSVDPRPAAAVKVLKAHREQGRRLVPAGQHLKRARKVGIRRGVGREPVAKPPVVAGQHPPPRPAEVLRVLVRSAPDPVEEADVARTARWGNQLGQTAAELAPLRARSAKVVVLAGRPSRRLAQESEVLAAARGDRRTAAKDDARADEDGRTAADTHLGGVWMRVWPGSVRIRLYVVRVDYTQAL